MPAIEADNSTLPVKEEPERDLVSWTAPARPFKRRNREFFVTVIAMAAMGGLLLFLIEGWLPVVLVISLVFLVYVMSTVEPEVIEYKVTTKGIKVAGRLAGWEIMRRFWFAKRFESELLVIETVTLPGRLEVVVKPELKADITKAISQYLAHEEVPASYLDKATLWFSARMPGGK